jgi:hypothetical protein
MAVSLVPVDSGQSLPENIPVRSAKVHGGGTGHPNDLARVRSLDAERFLSTGWARRGL